MLKIPINLPIILADSETPEGIQFRQHLLLRESARRAFVQADTIVRSSDERSCAGRGHIEAGMHQWYPGHVLETRSW